MTGIITPHLHYSYFTEKSFADIHRVNGLKGIYIASAHKNGSHSADNQVSYITFNKGASWRYISTPRTNVKGKRYNCSPFIIDYFVSEQFLVKIH